MAATFRTRPWQLAPLARPSFAPAAFHNTTPGIQAHMQQIRSVIIPKKRSLLTSNMRSSIRQTRKREDKQQATSSIYNELYSETTSLPPLDVTESAMLAPRTVVPVPLTHIINLYWPKILRYYFGVAKQRLIDRVQIFQTTWSLKDRWFSLATFKASRKGVVEKALELHAEMSQALAEGGEKAKERLDGICIPKLSRSLMVAIESRPPGRSYKWERVKLVGKPFWPRLVDHKWSEMDVGYMLSFRQAVVGIKSKQRLTELKDGKEVDFKEMELLEYVVLWALMDRTNKTQGEWFIYGTLKPTSIKDMETENEMNKKLADILAKDGLEKSREKLET